MIFKLTMDFIQHLIHQHCCTRTWAHAKHDGATAELNRSKNPILISPAWIVSFVALDAWVKSCFLALPKRRRGMEKKLDNERHYTSASERIQCVLLDCAYFVLCVFATLANLTHTHHYRLTCNQRRTITRCHLNYTLKAFLFHTLSRHRGRDATTSLAVSVEINED